MSDSRSDDQRSPGEIRADIDKTREELGDTAAALAGKADVKGQAKAKVEEAKASASEAASGLVDKARQLGSDSHEGPSAAAESSAHPAMSSARRNPVPLALAAAFAGGLLLGLVLRR